MDDISITGKTFEETLNRSKEVLGRLQKQVQYLT